MDKMQKQRRIELELPGVVTANDGVTSRVVIRDLSKDGCRLDTEGELVEGEKVMLKVGKEEPVQAIVRWALGGEAGLSLLDRPRLGA